MVVVDVKSDQKTHLQPLCWKSLVHSSQLECGLRVGSNLLCADNFSDDGTSISGTCDLSETTDGNDFVFFNVFAGNSFNFDSDLFELFPKFLLLSASSFNNNDLTGFDGFSLELQDLQIVLRFHIL